jgi:predicted transcriptional regulator
VPGDEGPHPGNRQRRVRVIAESAPKSLAALAQRTGRHKSNLSRTLKTMERYGFVQLKPGERGSLIPRVPYQTISLVLPLRKLAGQQTEAP